MSVSIDTFKQLADTYFEDMVKDRRHLHQYPEISYKEFETTEYIKKQLDELEIPYEQPLETGCVGILQGGIESDRVIALRADIDALEIQEEGLHKHAFMSKNDGVAHCCGHDIHTANLLGAARILKELQDTIEGKVLLVFQPAEEKLPGGGRLLCETGFLQDQGVDVIYGLHANPDFSPGEIAIRKGPFMASPDEFELEIIGEGGHAAAPHNAVDPIVLGAQVVTALQTIVSRSVDPNEPAVVTVGKIEGGTVHNIIPEKVRMIGTIRTFSESVAKLISSRIEQLAKGITEASDATYKYSFNPGYPAVDNTGWAVDNLAKVGSELLGDKHVINLEKPMMAGEDFAFYQKQFPGAFFFLGSGSEESGSIYSWHHPKYNVDEESLKTGSALFAGLVFQEVQSDFVG